MVNPYEHLNKWFKTGEGVSCADISSLLPSDKDKRGFYLECRLKRAYTAGFKHGVEAIAGLNNGDLKKRIENAELYGFSHPEILKAPGET